ncbi:uncharacterized protein LOC141898959 [Tubulanus polymorphus]|uniref:uncharacterized protein LOC141898959 n=1 Tax=Tubulanus polymorphus TaxID=672921 RepID=UPI003DA58B03
MLPTDRNIVLKFFFFTFPYLVASFRNYEKCYIKSRTAKSKVKFLQECYAEKVVPRSLSWIWKYDSSSAFPPEANKQLKFAIDRAKEDCNYQFYKFRQSQNYLKSHVPDLFLWKSLSTIVQGSGKYHQHRKSVDLINQLNKLIDSSPWTRFSNTENIVNLSSTTLSSTQCQLLGYGLNFSLPHQDKHVLDFVTQLEYRKSSPNSLDYNFIFMNLQAICDQLNRNLFEYLPRRFRLALQELRKLKTIKISKADKGGKIVILDLDNYNVKMQSLLDNPGVYKKLKSNPLPRMQANFNRSLSDIIKRFPSAKETLNKFHSRLPSLPYIYGLPKIHKDNVPLRPIVSNCNSPTYRLSKFLAKQLSPVLDIRYRYGKSS